MKEILTEEDFKQAAETLKCEVAAIKAVCAVEAPKGGFNKDDSPVILFEPFLFSDYTKGKYDDKTVKIGKDEYPLSINRRKKTWSIANAKYGPSSIQHSKLQAASELDRDAALKACSWGKFQILGSNYLMCGCKTLQEFINLQYKDEASQLKCFISFLKSSKLDKALRAKDWVTFAIGYNGPRQDKGTKDTSDDYSTYIEKAYKKLV